MIKKYQQHHDQYGEHYSYHDTYWAGFLYSHTFGLKFALESISKIGVLFNFFEIYFINVLASLLGSFCAIGKLQISILFLC